MFSDGQRQVELRRLGKSDLYASIPILGATSFGRKHWSESEREISLLKAAWDRGIMTWDTSYEYSQGESERIIGKALKQYDIPRDRVTILTKCGGPVNPNIRKFANVPDYVYYPGLSRASIYGAVEASLARLGTPYIDLLQVHQADLEHVSAEETMKALHDLVQSGKVRYIGASMMQTLEVVHYNRIAETNGWTKFISMQTHYSLVNRQEELEIKRYCEIASLGHISVGSHRLGFSARTTTPGSQREKRPMEVEISERVEEIAKERGWTWSQVALAWIKENATSAIIPFYLLKDIDSIIIPASYKLTEEDVEYIREPYEPHDPSSEEGNAIWR